MAGRRKRDVAGPSAATLSTDAAVSGLGRLSRVVENVLIKHQLTVAQFRLLDRLEAGSAFGKSLADWLAVKPPSVSAVVDGLVKRGLVDRAGDGADRRQVSHTLTTAGQRAHRAAADDLGERLQWIVGHLDDPGAAARLLDALEEWNTALDLAFEAKYRQPADGASPQ